MSRLAANFAFQADVALVLGGRLKFEEMLSGRFADALSTLYLGYATVWFYEQNKNVEGLSSVFELAMETLLLENQKALTEIASNFPIWPLGQVMSLVTFPLGASYSGPTDKMRQRAAEVISTPNGFRNLISQGVFISSNPADRLRKLNDVLPKTVAADKAVAAAKKEKRELTAAESALISEVQTIVNDIIQVNVFDKLGVEKQMDDSYVRPALRNTRFAEDGHSATNSRVTVKATVSSNA